MAETIEREENVKSNHRANGKFAPGNSASRGRSGKPEACRKYALSRSMEILVAFANIAVDETKPLRHRIECGKVVLERGLGKPVQQIESDSLKGGFIIKFLDEELAEGQDAA